MIPKVIQQWHTIVNTKNMDLLNDILDDDACMVSPVVHTVQKGKSITQLYLTGAASILCNETFKYTREAYGDGFAVLEFETELNGLFVNGVDIISWNADEKITEFKVMVRPLKAINALHQAMGEALLKMNG